MSTDFFDEVEGGLRAERYRSVFARSWPWLLAALVIVVVAVGAWWGLRERREQAGRQASETYQRALDAAERQDSAAATRAFGEAAEAGSPGYEALALMQQGALAARSDLAAAVRFYDRAADAAPTPLIGDAAALQAAFAAMDRGDGFADLERRLRPLAEEGRPYRVFAREALATLLAANGRTAEARREFVVLSLLEDAPETLRARAQLAIQTIDSGGAPAVAGIARAAAALPAEPPLPVTQLPPAVSAPTSPAAPLAPASGPAR